jgi:hypothetical protein
LRVRQYAKTQEKSCQINYSPESYELHVYNPFNAPRNEGIQNALTLTIENEVLMKKECMSFSLGGSPLSPLVHNAKHFLLLQVNWNRRSADFVTKEV